MVDVARVNIFGIPLGTVRWDDLKKSALFEYVPEFLNNGIEPSPLLMPVRTGRVYSFGNLENETYKGLPGLLADALPDTYGRALFERWLSLTGRTSSNPIETLCFLGKRCMGALEFEPVIGSQSSKYHKFEIDTLVEVARDALIEKEKFGVNFNDDKKTAIAEIVRLGTSAGGQRAKAIIAYNKSTGEVRSGQIDAPPGFDYYIIKLDGVNTITGLRETENYGRLEYSFYRLCKECGIEISDSELKEENGRAHFMTKRFDRINGEKIHLQTLCAIAHYDYRLHRAYSYEQAFDVMRALRLPYPQAREMFKRMVLNVVIRNQDDHTKNISFLMNKTGEWSLSPAYDVGFAYNPLGGWTSTHQMSINGKFENISKKDLIEIATKNNIKNPEIIIDEISEKASQWPVIAGECEVPKEMVDSILKNMHLNL